MKTVARIVPAILAALFVCAGGAEAVETADAATIATEQQVKAAYLYNFSLFVDWPAGSFENDTADIKVCVLGEDPFGDLLESTFKGRQSKGRQLIIKRSKWAQDLQGCHIVYISPAGNPADQLKKFAGTHVLTVGDTPGLAEKGATINFFSEENRIRFEVNLPLARKAGLTISSRMLQVGRIVGEERGGTGK